MIYEAIFASLDWFKENLPRSFKPEPKCKQLNGQILKK